MDDKAVLQCGQCGHGFTRAAAGSDRIVHCPVCDAEVETPRSDQQDTGPRLKLQRFGTAGGQTVLCPSCRAPLPPAARVCDQCGANQQTASSEEEAGPAEKPPAPPPPPPRHRPRARRRIPFVWILLAVAVAGVVWLRRPGPEPEPTSEPAVPTVDPMERLAEVRDRLRREWDAEQSLVERGDDLELEHITGRVIRGRLVRRIENRAADVLTEQGREVVAFEDLRSHSRIIVDAAYRSLRLEEEARRAAGLPPASP